MEWPVQEYYPCIRKCGENLNMAFIIPFQAYKHIFTSPSSVEKEPKATRSGNARIHGMTRVTPPSIAYVATQVNILLRF